MIIIRRTHVNVMYCALILNAAYAVRGGIKALMTLSGALAVADVALGYIDRIIKANEVEIKKNFKNEKDYIKFKDSWDWFYQAYQISSSVKSILSNMTTSEMEERLLLVNDGLNVINTYMSESSKFTSEDISTFNELLKQIELITNDNSVVY